MVKDLKEEMMKDGKFAKIYQIYEDFKINHAQTTEVLCDTLRGMGAHMYYDYFNFDQPRNDGGHPITEQPSVIRILANYNNKDGEGRISVEERAKEAERVATLLTEHGIEVKVTQSQHNEPCIDIDYNQPDFATKLSALQEAFKGKIIEGAQKALESLEEDVRGDIDFVMDIIPRKLDGKALDVDFAVKALSAAQSALNDVARSLDVENALKAAQSPRTGRVRAKTGGSDGDA